MVLVDTSVWVAVFRPASPLQLGLVVDIDDVVTCLPVVQEVLQGIDAEPSFKTAREALLAMTVVESPLRQEVVDTAVQLYRTARRAGLTVRSSVDCLIAACALRHGLQVLHADRDFDTLARVSPLDARNIGKRTAAAQVHSRPPTS